MGQGCPALEAQSLPGVVGHGVKGDYSQALTFNVWAGPVAWWLGGAGSHRADYTIEVPALMV